MQIQVFLLILHPSKSVLTCLQIVLGLYQSPCQPDKRTQLIIPAGWADCYVLGQRCQCPDNVQAHPGHLGKCYFPASTRLPQSQQNYLLPLTSHASLPKQNSTFLTSPPRDKLPAPEESLPPGQGQPRAAGSAEARRLVPAPSPRAARTRRRTRRAAPERPLLPSRKDASSPGEPLTCAG